MTNGSGNSGGFSGGFPAAPGGPSAPSGFPPAPGAQQPQSQQPQQPQQPPQPQAAPQMPPPQMPQQSFAPPQHQPNAGFMVDIDADPLWEPIEQTDYLEQDGFYCCSIIRESVRQDGAKTPGVFLSLQIQDEDNKGKTISKFMTDPKASKNDTRFVWRLLFYSISGSKDQARSAFRYQPGMLTNQKCYVKTNADQNSNTGKPITNVDTFVTQAEYEQAVKEGRHRWKAQQKARAPMGVPSGFSGAPGTGFPPLGSMVGGPNSPTPQTAPPPGGAPMQGAPQGTVQQAQQPQQPTSTPQPTGTVTPISGFPPSGGN